jgi:hypothetical protein
LLEVGSVIFESDSFSVRTSFRNNGLILDKLPLLKPLLDLFVKATGNEKYQLIQIACRHNNVSMLKYLIKNGEFSKFTRIETNSNTII